MLRDLVFTSIIAHCQANCTTIQFIVIFKNLIWVNITIGDDLLLVNIPQRLLRLNLALKGAGQPDDQELQKFNEIILRDFKLTVKLYLTNCHSYSNPNHRVEIVLNKGLNPRNAALCVDLQHCLCFSLLLQYPANGFHRLNFRASHPQVANLDAPGGY